MLHESVFDTMDLPAEDRFEAWTERMGRTHAPLDLSSDHTADYHAHQRVIALGEVVVWPATFDSLVFHRTPKLVRRSDPELYHLSLLVQGAAGATWDGREATYRNSDIHINSSSRSYKIRTGSAPVTMVGVEIPRALVALPARRADQAVGRPVSGREGVGALLSQFLSQFASDTASFQAQNASLLGTVVADLVTAVFAHMLDADLLMPPETHDRTLVLRIKAFVRRHLGDPELTPAQIAAAHHISRSHLYRLFQSEGLGVGAYIRDQRLAYARRDLTDPALRALPIHAVAARWGFCRPADFTRAFRALYGVPPSELRRSGAAGDADRAGTPR
ncbi:helix-turn-helix domain-containing protein [Streptomyces sp. NPDC059096]|uniref:AraC-like ligand-binding domain-containing protein n=1 Tax=unclassified Streptomyces TaxID=2593676 RepID=UPI00367F8769